MTSKKWAPWMFLLISSYVMTDGAAGRGPVSIQSRTDQTNSSNAELITAEELKAKLARNEPITIIDVRDTSSYVGSGSKIKGSIHLKLRRLHYRLSFPPLKNVPRDSEVVTYCACPHDEASFHAVQILSDAGFKRARVLKGGWQMWLKVNGQLESKPKGI
jgi:rhodanese-related sulfurtransferase